MQIHKSYLYISILLIANTLFAQIDYTNLYRTDNASSIYLPLGKISFADSVIDFKMGDPPPYKKFRDATNSLFEPNYISYSSPTYVSLGCKGSLIVAFTDNGFMNLPGYDLYIFEVGPSKESAKVEVSINAIDWLYAGTIAGGKSAIDLDFENIATDTVFYFVRITDLKELCKSKTAGADIDAIGAINAVIKLNINADVLFDSDQFTLKDSAGTVLDRLVKKIQQVNKATILVEGHTDNDGTETYNLTLSKKRSESVVEKLRKSFKEENLYDFEIKFYGENKPKTSNDTPENKQINRRVEITVLPPKDYYNSLLKED